jgi:ABC-type branched-subunit amino acid transport system ATPase component
MLTGLQRARRGLRYTRHVPSNSDPEAPTLAVAGIHKQFGGVAALTGVSFSLQCGEITGIIGPNGAGKSTLVNVITGVYPPDSGQIKLQDVDITRLNAKARANAGIMRTFQHTRSLTSFTVEQALRLAGKAPRAGSESRDSRESIADRFGLSDVLQRRFSELPYGTQKVINLCLIAMNYPMVVMLDEPFAGVTATDIKRLEVIVRELCAGGCAVGLIEHDMAALMRLSQRVIVLDAGKVIMEGTPTAVRLDPGVQEVYLGRRHR